MYRILEIEGEGNRDESDGRERYTFYTRKNGEAFSASFSPRIDPRPARKSTRSRWIDESRRVSLSTSRTNREREKIVHFGEQETFETLITSRSSNKDDARLSNYPEQTLANIPYILEDNLDSRRGQRIRSILSLWYYCVPTIDPYFINF